MERIRRGNPPELQAKLNAIRGTARAKLEGLRQSKTPEANDEGLPEHSRVIVVATETA